MLVVARKALLVGLSIGLLVALAQTIPVGAAVHELRTGSVTVDGRPFNSVPRASTHDCTFRLRFSGFDGGAQAKIKFGAFQPTFERKVFIGELVDLRFDLSANGTAERTVRVPSTFNGHKVPTDGQGRMRIRMLVRGGPGEGDWGYEHILVRGC